MVDINEIKECLSLITEGKWFTYRDETTYVGTFDEDNHRDEMIAECWTDGDAYFIAKAPEYVRRLLDEVDRLNAELEKITDDKNLFRDLFIKKQLEEK